MQSLNGTDRHQPQPQSPRVAALLKKIQAARPRLIFALDATGSRGPTWDMAAHLQAQMFETVAASGGLDVQLVYFRGWGECRASAWMSDARALGSIMTGISCKAGHTQIRKVLDHVRKEHDKQPVSAVVFVGDQCEEIPADLYEATCAVPVFLFQEGDDPQVTEIFGTIAKLTGGAHSAFNANSSVTLGELLAAVAAFAVGGVKLLANQHTDSARKLLGQMK